METDFAATLEALSLNLIFKTFVTENEKGKLPETSGMDDNVSNLINDFNDSIDYMNWCDADRKFIDNRSQINKNVSKEI